jgi:4-hydroxy-2-oxoheptanedioate aldolase
MNTPPNPFKAALQAKQAQIGLWLGLADCYSTEICAGAGFDWLLVDAEHAPAEPRALLGQLQAIGQYPGSHPVGRIPQSKGAIAEMLVKQFLDLGFTSLLIPMVDTPEQAQTLVRASRFPQNDDVGSPLRGVRGMANARSNRFGRVTDYAKVVNKEICLLMQAESQEALDNIEAIAAIDGVDGIFIGPADLSASLGHVLDPTHPDVQKAIDSAIRRITSCGKAAGILTPDETLARHYLDLGATFVAVGLDTNLLTRHTSALAAKFKGAAAPAALAGKVY